MTRMLITLASLCLVSASVKKPVAKHRHIDVEDRLERKNESEAFVAAHLNFSAIELRAAHAEKLRDDAVDVVFEPAVATRYQPTKMEMLVAYAMAMIVMSSVVTLMFYPLGVAVVFQCVLYVFCLAVIKIALKLVYEYGFNYPTFITAVHLLVSSFASFIVLLHRKSRTGKIIATPTRDELLFGILPIASTFGVSVAAQNCALVFVSAAFSEVVASTNPVMSFALAWIFGMGSKLSLLAPIAVVVFGCVISMKGEMYFSWFGLALLLLSVVARGLKATLQEKLMTGESKEKFEPVTLMAWSCLCACGVIGVYASAMEGMAPITAIATSTDKMGLMAAIFASSAIACILNISALFVVKQLGAVGMQMVSQMKALLVVIGGMALLGETFTNIEKLGFGIVLVGVYWYSRMQRKPAASTTSTKSTKA